MWKKLQINHFCNKKKKYSYRRGNSKIWSGDNSLKDYILGCDSGCWNTDELFFRKYNFYALFFSSSTIRRRLSCWIKEKVLCAFCINASYWSFHNKNVWKFLCICYACSSDYVFLIAYIIYAAPIDTPNKRLDSAELCIYGKRTRITVLVLIILSVIFSYAKAYRFSFSIMTGMIMEAYLMLKGQIYNSNFPHAPSEQTAQPREKRTAWNASLFTLKLLMKNLRRCSK